MIALVASPPGDGAVTFIYVLLAVVAVIGGGGAIGIWRSSRSDRKREREAAVAQGIRDEKLDRVIEVVLPDDKGNGGLINELQEIRREQQPNGGNTQRLGDIALRTERAVGEIKTKLDTHIGQSGEVHEGLRRRLSAIERKQP